MAMEWRDAMAEIERGPHCTCPGTDEKPWDPECVFHTIGHYHRPGCCDVAQDESEMAPHRLMTGAEFNAEFPKIYGAKFQAGDTWYSVSARRYWDGIGATIDRLFDQNDEGGLCFDLPAEAIGPMAEELQGLVETIRFAAQHFSKGDK